VISLHSKVHALSHPLGDLLWSSTELEGSCEGTPYYTSDGAYVFVTHNSEGETVGHFSVLDTAADASVFYTYFQDKPFGPFAMSRDNFPGGNYGAGAGNTNDLAVWGLKPSPSAASGEQGSVFAFQMPPITSLAGGPSVTTLLNTTSWRHTAPPLLAARGQQAYWLISRSEIRAWINSRFSIVSDAMAAFERGSPPFKAAPYTPVVNDILAPTVMCGGPANEAFACLGTENLGTDGTMPTLWSVPLGTGLVYGDPLMSTGGDRVYWTDTAGVVSAADPMTGTGGWTSETGVVIRANPELSSDGALFFFADTGGAIVAWEVAEGTLPNVTLPGQEPTVTPGEQAPSAPGGEPVPTAMPIMADTPELGGADSFSPSGIMDTSMPSPSPMPILTASPVSRPDPTSGASSFAVCSLIAASIVAGLLF